MKLQGWKEKLLSQAGMEVLLIVMVQATPTFSISCFKLCIILYHVFDRGNDPKILVGLRDNRKKKPIGSSGVKCLLLKKTLNKKKVIVYTTPLRKT